MVVNQMQNICVFDNILSNKECDFLIDDLKNNIQGSYGNPHNYNYCDVAYDGNEILSNLTTNIIKQYTKLNPEINLTYNKWKLQNFKFKEFIPGNYYNKFHSEQSFNRPRILSILVYLSTHNCGTEFYNKVIPRYSEEITSGVNTIGNPSVVAALHCWHHYTGNTVAAARSWRGAWR